MAVSALGPCIRVSALSQDQLWRESEALDVHLLHNHPHRYPGQMTATTLSLSSYPHHSCGATPRLTQETTRPLKQGNLALSSKISSFTTL